MVNAIALLTRNDANPASVGQYICFGLQQDGSSLSAVRAATGGPVTGATPCPEFSAVEAGHVLHRPVSPPGAAQSDGTLCGLGIGELTGQASDLALEVAASLPEVELDAEGR